MSKAETKTVGSDGKDADAWASPEMSALDNLIKKIVKVPKSEIDKALAEERERNAPTNNHKH